MVHGSPADELGAWARRALAVAAAALVLPAGAAADRPPVLLKPPGPRGCLGPSPGCSHELGRLGVRAWVAASGARVVFGDAHAHDVDYGGPEARAQDVVVPFRRSRDGRLHPPGPGCARGRAGCARLRRDELVQDMRLSPDGRTLLAITQRRLLVFRPGARGRLRAPGVAAELPSDRGWAGLALAPDGRSAYATFSGEASQGKAGAVVGFSVSPASGRVRRLPGPAGCLRAAAGSVPPEYAACGPLGGLVRFNALAVSPDDRFVDAAASTAGTRQLDEVVALRRNPRSGTLRPVACAAGGRGMGCARLRGVQDVWQLVASARGTLYVVGQTGGAILRQRRDGSLAQPAGARGCLPPNCSTAVAPGSFIALAPGGRLVRSITVEDELDVLRPRADGTIGAGPDRANCLTTSGFADCYPLATGGSPHGIGFPVPIPRAPLHVLLNAEGNVLELGPPQQAQRPDGRRLAFLAGATAQLYSVAEDGRNDLRRLVAPLCLQESDGKASFDRRGDLTYRRDNCGQGGIVIRPRSRRPRLVAGVQSEAEGPSLSHSGRLLAYVLAGAAGRHAVWMLDRRTHRTRRAALGDDPAFGPANRLAWAGPRGLLVGVPGGRPRRVTRTPRCRSPRRALPRCEVLDEEAAWTSAGTVVFTRITRHFQVDCDEGCQEEVSSDLWEVRPGRRPRRLTRVGDAEEPAVSADGRLAYVRSGTVWVRRLHGRRTHAVADGLGPAWMP
jgi:hypothetical protein